MTKNNFKFETHRHCPHCGPGEKVTRIAARNGKITPAQFASRGEHKRIHPSYHLCCQCRCLFASPSLSLEDLKAGYHFGYEASPEVGMLAAEAYKEFFVEEVQDETPDRQSLMEIGCGAGWFLQSMKEVGFERVVGFDPSESTVTQAPESIRGSIIRENFNPTSATQSNLSVICLFQVAEHLFDPQSVFTDLWKRLKPGGILYIVSHNHEAMSARLLGPHSPIYDFQHCQLYSPGSLSKILRTCGFESIHTKSFENAYPLNYWWHLLPIAYPWKGLGESLLELSGLANRRVPIQAGNFALWAKKPLYP